MTSRENDLYVQGLCIVDTEEDYLAKVYLV